MQNDPLLQRTGRAIRNSRIPSTSAEALLDRMLNKIDDLCAERDWLKKEQPSKALRRWFDDESNPTPFLKALEEARRLATREGWRYQHVQGDPRRHRL